MATPPRQKIYLIVKGRKPGVYTSKESWKEYVLGFPGYVAKSFKNVNAALSWWRIHDIDNIIRESDIRKAFTEQKHAPAAAPKSVPAEKPKDASVIEFRRTPLKIYTDASITGETGGWAAIALTGEAVCQKLKGVAKKPVSNSCAMELTAIRQALKTMEKQGWNLNEACILTDCQYIVNHWMKNIRPNDDNKKIWKKVWKTLTDKNMSVCWIKGHAGNIYNEECDRLAREAVAERLAKKETKKKKKHRVA